MEMGQLRGTVETLHKIVTNILSQSLEPKFRKLPKKSQSLQEKVLKFGPAVEFLKVSGFADQHDCMMMADFDRLKLEQANKALEEFVQSLGA